MSHPLLAKMHDVLLKIKNAFKETPYKEKTNGIIRTIEMAYVKTANGTFESSASEESYGERLSAKKRRALETASLGINPRSLTAISSADGAKILQNIDNLILKYKNSSTQPKTFVGEMADALDVDMKDKSSKYANFECKNGNVVTIRISDHNATSSNLDINGQNNAISIVVTNKNNIGIINDGNAHIVEYYYNAIKLRKAEGKPLADIAGAIKQALYSGEFKDPTGLAERQEVNMPNSDENVLYSLRQKPEPEKKGTGYKVFVLGKDGKLYPPMVANPNGAATPVGVWLDADAAPVAGESKTGRPQVKQGGKGTQGGSGKLAYRPGWHLGVIPYAIQFNRKDAEGNKTLFPKNFVFAEVEYAADKDYQDEAHAEGINSNGKYQHSLAGLKHLPTDGYYMYRTNPNPETDPWVITGAMKVNRLLTRAEQADIVRKAGREPQQIQEGDIVTDDVVNSINQEIAAAPKFSLKVYHGSGADFTEFDFDHMGEGAGTQAFGWGGYVTSSKKIGKSYADLNRVRNLPEDIFDTENKKAAASYVQKLITQGYDKESAIQEVRSKYDGFLDNLNHDDTSRKNNGVAILNLKERIATLDEIEEGKLPLPTASLYEVDIPDDNGSNYLEWDAPITDELIDKVAKALPSLRSYDIEDLKKDRTFDNFYKTISMRSVTDDASFNDDKAASKLLSSLGFTGIKYPAGTIYGGAEEGDVNYVIFKPEDMQIVEHEKFSVKSNVDNQGNPLNQDGTLKLEKIKSVDELTDEDFLHPTRNVELPSLPKKIADAIGTEGKPVVIKKNIFERNYMRHKDVTPELSKKIFKSALYNPDLYGQNQKKTRPYNWVLINTKDEKGNNRTVLLEVNPNKDNVEIVHWHFIDERGLKKIRKQVDREDGQLLILPSDKEEVGALSDPTVNLSAANIANPSETSKGNAGKFSLRLQNAINETDTEPTEAQKKSGNYKKGHVKFGGYDYTIENPKGSYRSGVDENGKEWKQKMNDTYGYIRGKFGKDGDHLDMFINDKADLDSWNGDVFVVDQVNPDGKFDEHKVMYGYDSLDEAKKAYLSNYEKGWTGLGNITPVSKAGFDKWLDKSNRKLKPFADYADITSKTNMDTAPSSFEEFLEHPAVRYSIRNEKERAAAEDAYNFAQENRPDRYSRYAIVNMEKPGAVPQYLEKKAVADNWRRYYNKLKWGNYKLFDLDKPFEDNVKNLVGKFPETFRKDNDERSSLKSEINGGEPKFSLKDVNDKFNVTYAENGNEAAEGERETTSVRLQKSDIVDVESMAEEYGLDGMWLARYAEGMREKNSAAAVMALRDLKALYLREHIAEKKMLMERDGLSGLLANRRLFEPIEQAIKAKYGDVDVLVEERRKQVEIERGMMEAARKRAEEEQRKREARLEELAGLTDEEIDNSYAEALAKGDEAAAREMLDEGARRKGYGDAESEYQGVGAWGAPSKPGYETDEARRNAVGEDSPDLNVEDMAAGYNNQPEDIFVHPDKYSQGLPTSKESGKAIQAAIDDIRNGKKDVKVKVYRAVPASVKEGKLRNGDWVTPSKMYAELHGDNRLEGKYRIIEAEVPVSELWWDSNDVNEWGYDNGKSYRYKNVKNNRKLNDLVTRDDKGNVIPPSKRFNQRKADERYQRGVDGVKPSKSEVALRDAVIDRLRENGMDVIADEAGQRVLDMANGRGAVRTHAMISSLTKAANTIRGWIIGNKRGKSFTIELPETTRRMIRKVMGRDFDSHNITANNIVHAYANHGVGGSKITDSSIPLTKEDMELMPYIMTAPDYIRKGSEDITGRESIRFYKTLSNGYVVVVEKEQKNSPHDMESITMWAEKSPSNVADARINSSPTIDARNVIISTEDAAKIRKDAEEAIVNDVKVREQRVYHGSGADFKAFDQVRFFRTANGDAYGFTVGGKIYIDPRIATSETPVHEYAHLWATALRNGNAEEWQNVVGLMKDTKVWDDVKERYPELKSDDDIADEVIATYSGSRGAEHLRAEQSKIAEGNGSIFEKAEAISALEKVKQALKKFWKGVADLLHIHYKSAEEVADRVMKDLLDGVDPRKIGKAKDGGAQFSETINSSDNIRFSLKEEKKKIVSDAKANGTYMTAPNGEKTKLNAEQWVTVRTTSFKNWFGDWENDPDNASKVVDENGEPMVVWHGRSAEFNTFEKKEGVRFIMGLEDKVKAEGFFFSPNKGLAEEFASNSFRHRGGKANVIPCFLNIRKPMDLTKEDYDRIYEDVTGWDYIVGMDTQDNLWGIMDEEGMADKIKGKGYDGVIFVEEVDDNYEPTKISYCALDANQIKSADNNNGDFSTENDDIRYSLKNKDRKQAQLDIILKTNPMLDDYHTGIRKVEDIKTLGESVEEARSEAEKYGDDEWSAYPDITNDMLQNALETGEITIYSSKPIKNGVFVTPSYMQASDYAGGGNVYEKTVPLTDVAWINTDEGQYAKVDGERYSLKEVNDKFNDRLAQLIENPNQKDRVLHLGRSSQFLIDGGIADAEIELDFDKLMRKSKFGYVHEHPFDAADVKDLPLAIANPISVFVNTNGQNDGQVILTELKKDDRNFIVVIRTESQNRKGGVILKVNKIATLFPKDARGVINWYNLGKATNIDKAKALHFIEALQNHSGTLTSEELSSAAKIVRNFVNPKQNDGNLQKTEKYSLRVDRYRDELNQWKKDNNLPKDAERPQLPVREPNDRLGFT